MTGLFLSAGFKSLTKGDGIDKNSAREAAVVCEARFKPFLKDPDSYKRKSFLYTKGTTTVTYRAKTSIGGYDIETHICKN